MFKSIIAQCGREGNACVVENGDGEKRSRHGPECDPLVV